MVLISVISVAIFFSSAFKVTLIVYNPVTNSSTRETTKKGRALQDAVDIQTVDGYEFYDYYSSNFEKRLGKDFKTSKNSEIVVLGYIKTINSVNLATNDVVGVKCTGIWSNYDLESLFEKHYTYIDLSTATIEGTLPSNNTSIEVLKLPSCEIVGANNFTQLKTVYCNEDCQISNAFNGCLNLENVEMDKCQSITSSFANCTSLKAFTISENLTNMEKSFIETPLETVVNNSNNFLLENDVLYQREGQSLVAKKALANAIDIQINNQTTKIDEYAFYKHSKIKSLTLDAKVSIIGEKAFYNSSIQRINILQDSVLDIEQYAFANCQNLAEISLGRAINTIGDFAFAGCKIQTLIFSQDCVLAHIGKYAFSQCSNLTSIELSNKQMTIDEGAFANNKNLQTVSNLNAISLPNKLFENCANLSSLQNFSGVKTVGNYAFSNCQSLSNIDEINQIESAGIAAFSNCKCLTQAKFLNLSKLTQNLFLNCTSLTKFASAEPITQFESSAFDGCYALESVSLLGDFLVENGAIYNADRTQIVYYLPTQNQSTFLIKETVENINIKALSQNPYIQQYVSQSEHFSVVDGVLFDNNQTCLIAYPNASSAESYVVPAQTKEISAYAFGNTQNLISLEINEQIEVLNCGFLWQNHSIQTLKTPFIGKSSKDLSTGFLGWFFGAEEFGNNNIYVSTSLKNVEVYNQEQFSEGCFYNCANLLTIKLPMCGEVTKMMFYCCYNLQSISLGGALTKIDEYAFYDCQSLISLNFVYNSAINGDDIKLNAFEKTPSNAVSVIVYCGEAIETKKWVQFKEYFGDKMYNWRWTINTNK